MVWLPAGAKTRSNVLNKILPGYSLRVGVWRLGSVFSAYPAKTMKLSSIEPGDT